MYSNRTKAPDWIIITETTIEQLAMILDPGTSQLNGTGAVKSVFQRASSYRLKGLAVQEMKWIKQDIEHMKSHTSFKSVKLSGK